MASSGLDACLSGIGEETTCDTEEDLCADDAGVCGRRVAATVVDQKAEGDGEKARTEQDERLEAADAEDDQTEECASDDRGEAVHRRDARGRFDGLVESDDEDRVEEITLNAPCEVEETGDAEGTPDGTVLQELEPVLAFARKVIRGY